MRFLRYILVQVVAYGLDMGGFVLLFTYFAVEPVAANVVSKILAGLFAFIAHRGFTFRVTGEGGASRQAIRYFTLLGLNIPFSALLLIVMLRVIPAAVIAKFVADVICVAFTYWLSKRFVFLSSDTASSNVVDGQSK